jgi:hypothetical protein
MIARIAIELPPGTPVSDFERELARLAERFGTNLERSADPRMPAHYVMAQRQRPRSAAGGAEP